MKDKINKKPFIVLIIICFLLVVIILFIGFGVPAFKRSSYNEKNTYEYSATVSYVEVSNNQYFINVNEYECILIAEPKSIIDANGFDNLIKGDKIYFRTFFKLEKLYESGFKQVDIVELKSNDRSIITIESSKAVVSENDIKVIITCVVFAILFFLCGIFFILCCVGVIPPKRKC